MNSLKDTYELYNGVKIPCIGFGTWQTPDGDIAVSSVKEAIAAGYRHIDTAAGYNNEESVGKAVRESGIPREELFITSKLHNSDHGYEATHAAFNLSMKKLGLTYLDLYLIHWPNPIKFRDTWKESNAGSWNAFEELYKAGKIRAIGVSNFMPRHMDALLETATIKPMVNQIRLCPGETQEAATSYCKANNIQLEAYSPLGTGRVFEVKEMQELSKKYKKSIAQICIRWSLQMGYLPLPKSVTPERIRENSDVFDFELSSEDVARIASLTECCGPTRDPDTANF